MSPGVLDFSEAKFLAMQKQNQNSKTKTENPLGTEPTTDLRAIEFDTSNFDPSGLDDDAACSDDAHAYDPEFWVGDDFDTSLNGILDLRDDEPATPLDEPATPTTPPQEPEHVTATLTATPAIIAPLDPEIAASVAGFQHLSGTLCDPSCEATPEADPTPEAPTESTATTTATTAPAAPTVRTKGDVLLARIEALETDILDLDREEHDLAERLSATRKSRKELLSDLRDTERSLTTLGPRADEPDESHAAVATALRMDGKATISIGGVVAELATCSIECGTASAPAVRAAVPDPAITASLSQLGLNEKQLEKFADEGINTIKDFEEALKDRSIEAVKGIQERTMDKIKDRLIDWRNKHGYGSPAEEETRAPETRAPETRAPEATATSPASESPTPEAPVFEPLTESEWCNALGLTPTPEAPTADTTPAVEPVAQPAWFNVTPDDPAPVPEAPTTAPDDPAPIDTAPTPTADATPADPIPTGTKALSPYELAKQAGRDARAAGLPITANPIKDSTFRASYWDDGWTEADEQIAASDRDASVPPPALTPVLAAIDDPAAEPPAKKKRGRKPKATAETATATATAE